MLAGAGTAEEEFAVGTLQLLQASGNAGIDAGKVDAPSLDLGVRQDDDRGFLGNREGEFRFATDDGDVGFPGFVPRVLIGGDDGLERLFLTGAFAAFGFEVQPEASLSICHDSVQ